MLIEVSFYHRLTDSPLSASKALNTALYELNNKNLRRIIMTSAMDTVDR